VHNAEALVLLTTLLLLASCSHQKTITREELRSQLTSAVSFAAEAEMFIDYVGQNRSTHNYAQGHIKYLADEVNRSLKELHDAVPGEGSEEKLRECRAQLDLLGRELTTVRLALHNAEALRGAKERIATIRKALERAKSSS
jgi:hypothetical protein